MAFEEYFGGDIGNQQDVGFYPDANLVTILDALKAAGNPLENVHVKMTTAANKQITESGSGEIPEGKIIACEEDQTYTYVCTVRWFGYVDYEGTVCQCPRFVELAYTGDPSLGEQIQSSGATAKLVAGVTTGGRGKIISIDDPTTDKLIVAL